MINKLLKIIAPHHCYGCGKTGRTLCVNCKYDITSEPFSGCFVCSQATTGGICSDCKTSYQRAWCVTDRQGATKDLINAFKFERVKDAYEPLADLLYATLPVLPSSTVVVPIPTVRKHIRQRGYDHTLLLAKRFARQRGLPLRLLLTRTSQQVQLGKTKRQRFAAAQTMFHADGPLDPDSSYLIIDDVVTTNATVRAAAEALKNAGAGNVWVAAVAKQPLEKQG